MLGQLAQYAEFKSLSAQTFHHQHQPKKKNSEPTEDPDQGDEQYSKHRNQVQNQCEQANGKRSQQSSEPQKQTLNGVKAHETIAAIGIESEKNDCRNESTICQRSGDISGQESNSSLHFRDNLHRSATSGAECRRRRHFGAAFRAGQRSRSQFGHLTDCDLSSGSVRFFHGTLRRCRRSEKYVEW